MSEMRRIELWQVDPGTIVQEMEQSLTLSLRPQSEVSPMSQSPVNASHSHGSSCNALV